MAKFVINGGKKLSGTVRVSGNKNSTFGLIGASLLANSPVTLTNIPNIRDIDIMVDILKNLGCSVEYEKNGVLKIDPTNLTNPELDLDLVGRIRGSVVLAAPLLARFGHVRLPRLGGDSIGERMIDTHLASLSKFGVNVAREDGILSLTTEKLVSCDVFLEEASVTATEMVILMAAVASGETIISDAASEPHVLDLCEMLIKMGLEVSGAGTNKVVVNGGSDLSGIEHKVRPDHIEVGTFAIAAAITQGDVYIHDVVKDDLDMILAYLAYMGVEVEFEGEDKLHIRPSELRAQRKRFQTRTWPGFPTDLMSLFIVLATQTKGTVLCHDWMYESRMFFVDHLRGMGADIVIADPHRVIVNGPSRLHGEVVPSPDIRAGSALVLAALAAEGESVVEHAEIIDRGYEKLDVRLASLGADIRRE